VNTDITSILRLNDWAGRIVLVFYGIGTTAVAVLNLGGLIVPALGVVSLALLWFALIVLSRPDGEPFGRVPTRIVVACGAIITSLSCWNIVNVLDPGYATWHLGATTFLFLVLALRGRRGMAWTGFGILSAISLGASFFTGQEPIVVANDLARQAATLLIGTLFALVLRRSSQTISAIQNNQLTRTTIAAATAAATRERALQTARLERDARPALERILSETPLTDGERLEFALLESMLRDGIRAAGFSSDRIAAATKAARERGLQVVLLDDRGSELEEAELSHVEFALLQQLGSTAKGAITARLSPHDRAELATIVVEEGGEYRRVVVTPDAVEVTHL
jgi:hypothetical protein